MPCAICHELGHTRTTCQSPLIDDGAEQVVHVIIDNVNELLSLITDLPLGVTHRKIAFRVSEWKFIDIEHNIPRSRGVDVIRQEVRQIRTKFLEDDSSWQIVARMKRITKFVRDIDSAVINRGLPKVLERLEHILTTGHNLPNLISELKVKIAATNINPSNKLRSLVQFISWYTQHIIIARLPESFLDHSNLMTLDELCVPVVIPNDDKVRNLCHLLANRSESSDNTSCITGSITTINLIRKIEKRAAFQTGLTEGRRGFAAMQEMYRSQSDDLRNQLKTQPVNIKFKMDEPDTEYFVDDACSICMEELTNNNMVAMSCAHTFCASCTGEFLNKCAGRKCPRCRDEISEIRFKTSLLPEHYNGLVSALRT